MNLKKEPFRERLARKATTITNLGIAPLYAYNEKIFRL